MLCRTLLLLFLALPSLLTAAPAFEVVKEFARPPRQPLGRLLYVPADGNYYGTTVAGGTYNRGTIFRLTPAGQVSTLVSFTGTTGAFKGDSPIAGMVIGTDGALYGTTQGGGAGDFGTAFRITTAGAFTTLVEFTGSGGSVRGSTPHELILAPDGFLYGVTEGGGSMDLGTVFRLSQNGLVVTLVDFTGTSGIRKGAAPVGALSVTGQVLFGVTQTGGAADLGTIYSVTTNGTWGLLAEFTGSGGNRKGANPSAGMVLHSDGILYGTTTSGGTGDFGTLFRITVAGIFTHIRQFSGPDGEQPAGALLSAPDGALYGTTTSGGANDLGTIFKFYTPDGGVNWVHSVLAEFTGEEAPTFGAFPEAGLSLGAGGKIVGVTSAGAPGGNGAIFSIDPSGAYTPIATFNLPTGSQPSGGLASAASGDLVLPLYEGGANGYGTLIRLPASGPAIVDTAFGELLGQNPEGPLLRVGEDFFGVTRGGGSNDRGTLFRHVPGVNTWLLASFSAAGGAKPEGPLIEGADGFLYGVAREGGTSNRGAIVRMSKEGVRTTLASFTGGTGLTRGQSPRAPLAPGPDGILYGVTERGGTADQGTIFSMVADGTITTLVSFTATGPRIPLGGLIASPDGALYGTTSLGGAGGAGTVFRLTPPNGFSVVAEFTGASGAFPGGRPVGSLTAALDGTLYGVTTEGGDSGRGTLYRLAPNAPAMKLAAFTGFSGALPGVEPLGGLLFGRDGFLYGSTASGGTGGGGLVYRVGRLGPHAGTDLPGFAPGSVVLRGSAQTGGEAVTTAFDYGPTAALGNTVASTTGGPGNSPYGFSAVLEGITPGTSVYFRSRATNASGTSFGSVRTLVVPPPFEAWKRQYFGEANVPATDDSDEDGMVNLAEYAILSSPKTYDYSKPLQPTLTTYTEGKRFAVSLPRDPSRTDITIEVQVADEVTGPWTTLASSTAGAPYSGPGYVTGDSPTPGVKTVEIRDIVNVGDVSSRFFRLQIDLP